MSKLRKEKRASFAVWQCRGINAKHASPTAERAAAKKAAEVEAAIAVEARERAESMTRIIVQGSVFQEVMEGVLGEGAPALIEEDLEAIRDAAAEAASTFGLREVGAVLAVFDLEASPEADAALRALEARVEALDVVASLVTPFDVPGIGSVAEARSHPIASRSLAPPGGLLLPVVPAETDAAVDWQDEVLAAARAGEATEPRLDVGLTGQWPIVQAQQDAYARERVRFQLLGVVVESEEGVGQSIDQLLDPRGGHHLAAILRVVVEEDVDAALRGHARR